jgi:hypothetical protein
MKSSSYDRLVEHWQTDLCNKADRPPIALGIVTQSAGTFMPRKPVFSTAC